MNVDAFKLDRRIAFAAERTLLSWVRTGLGTMGFGAVVSRFALLMPDVPSGADLHVDAVATGSALIGLGIFINVMGAVRYRRQMTRLRADRELEPSDERMVIAVALAFAVVGLVLMIGLLRLL